MCVSRIEHHFIGVFKIWWLRSMHSASLILISRGDCEFSKHKHWIVARKKPCRTLCIHMYSNFEFEAHENKWNEYSCLNTQTVCLMSHKSQWRKFFFFFLVFGKRKKTCGKPETRQISMFFIFYIYEYISSFAFPDHFMLLWGKSNQLKPNIAPPMTKVKTTTNIVIQRRRW